MRGGKNGHYRGMDTFFCRVKNVQVDEGIDVDTKGIDLTDFNPVVYSGNYHSIGEYLGAIGDFYAREKDC